MGLNQLKIRADFKILSQKINGKPLIYMDSACMSLKPNCVVEKINEYYYKYPSCVGRSNHYLSNLATREVDLARKTISKFIGAKKEKEIIFTRNTTEGINLIANSFDLKKGDIVLTSDKEHNSILLPFLLAAKKKGIIHQTFVFSDLKDLKKKLNKKVKLIVAVQTSNADGESQNVKEIIKIAHDNKTNDGKCTKVVIDGAQSVPHQEINVRKSGCDFLAFSGHKMCGPTGTGVLYGKEEELEKLSQYMIGGDTVHNSTYTSYEIEEIPARFEAGLSDYSGQIGLGEACRYLSKVGLSNIKKHEELLNDYISNSFYDLGVDILGSKEPKQRAGIVSFNIRGLDNHEVAMMLNHSANIMIRSGMHCVHSWFNAKKLLGSARASLYFYNTKEECDILIDEVKKLKKFVK